MLYGTKGTMQVDYEERIDFNRMRKQRVQRIKDAMAKTDFSCLLLFATENKRYATSTAVASPEVDNMGRYAIVPRGGEPYIFGFGSEAAAEKLNCPWIADRAYPAHTTMFGALPAAWKTHLDNFEADLKMVMEQNGIDPKDPIGVDIIDGELLTELQARGYTLGNGQEVMLQAREIKTDDEILVMMNAAATVDAAFYQMARALHPGVRENELQGIAANELHRLGGQWAINIQMTSGTRTHPHPHLSSDRLIQPGDLVFADIVTLMNGYHTCYYRTLCCGEPTQKAKDVYKSAYEMILAGIEQCKVCLLYTSKHFLHRKNMGAHFIDHRFIIQFMQEQLQCKHIEHLPELIYLNHVLHCDLCNHDAFAGEADCKLIVNQFLQSASYRGAAQTELIAQLAFNQKSAPRQFVGDNHFLDTVIRIIAFVIIFCIRLVFRHG